MARVDEKNKKIRGEKKIQQKKEQIRGEREKQR